MQSIPCIQNWLGKFCLQERIYAFLHNPTNGLSLPVSPVKEKFEWFFWMQD